MKFLIIRFSSIGDIVLTTPVIRCLKQQVPDATVHFLTKKSFKNILVHNPYIDKLLLLDESWELMIHELKIEEYDYIIKFCQQHNLEDLPFKQKIYHAINNISNIVLCKNPDCNNSVNYKNSTIGYYEYCSVRCISSDPNIKKIKREKSIAKFGTKTPAESEIIKNKIVKSNNEKYGGNSPMSNKLIQYKSKKTLLKNYGVDSPSKSEEILSKRIKSFKNSGYKESYKKTSLEKYGVEHPWMNKDIHIKSIEKIKITKNNLLKELVINKLNSQNDELLDIDYDKRIIKAKCKNGHTYTINRHMLYSRNKLNTILCTICNPIYSGISGMEVSLLHHIKQVYQDEILSNERILNGKEIDIYLPKLKLGFEFNGLWWHSEENKPINYHIDKYDEAKSLGIDLIFIWEDEWLYNQESIKNTILDIIDIKMNNIHFELKFCSSDIYISNFGKIKEWIDPILKLRMNLETYDSGFIIINN